MAGSQSFEKRENEKKRQAKRLEKQKRKEERQSEGTSSMDDMIAYVDDRGNITDTPPEERTKKEEVKLEDIAIATPKKEDEKPEIMKGRVECFNSDKGYGFIEDMASGERFFFHISAAPAGIAEGNLVTYETERGPRGMNAVRIALTR